ncbi:sulfatase [Glaciecola sp. SC05]|uniref:sulfatase n=1 Tax=Glaciecola sp. SC05 TaxID=1987355 RepID=UPI0035293AD5
MIRTFIKIAILVFISFQGAAKSQPNILFIAVDDLRPSIGAYGDELAITPNINKLAAQGTLFKQAFASVPTCGASRASLFTGIRPTAQRFLTFNSQVQVETPNATTIPKYLKQNGYYAVSLGKVFHKKSDSAEHWSEEPWTPKNVGNYHDPKNIEITQTHKGGRAYPYENYDYDDLEHKDGIIASKAIASLQTLSNKTQPFFLAVGFARPHLPFNAPKKYWDLYPEEKISLPSNYFRSLYAPDQAFHNSGELRGYYGVPKKGDVSDEMALSLKRGYYASVSFVDAQIGRVLSEIESLGLDKNTIVILWGDHGWQLGEHKLWNKHSNFKTSTHAPLIFSVPGKQANQQTDALTEFVDIFPTLCDLLGIPKPEQLQGESVAKLLDDPEEHKNTVAFIQWQGGTTMFTERYAYTEWFDKNGVFETNMLFDHKNDGDENVNLAQNPEHKTLISQLSEALNKKRLSIK